MNNIHPIYKIKELMIRRELAKDPKLKNESWERFLPKFKSKNIPKRKQPKIKKQKKPYTPFPPPQPESKIDKELASGEYFLSESEKRLKRKKELQEKKAEGKKKQEEKRKLPFIPPEENNFVETKKKKTEDINVEELKKKVKQSFQKKKKVK